MQSKSYLHQSSLFHSIFVVALSNVPAMGQGLEVNKELSYTLEASNLTLSVQLYNKSDAAVDEIFSMFFERPVEDSIKKSSEFGSLTGQPLDQALTKKYSHIFESLNTGKYVNGLKEIYLMDDSKSTSRYLSYLRVNECSWVEIRKSEKVTYHDGGYGRFNSTMFINLQSGIQFEIDGSGHFLTCDLAYGENGSTLTWRNVKSGKEVILRLNNGWVINKYAVRPAYFVVELNSAEKRMKYLEVKIQN